MSEQQITPEDIKGKLEEIGQSVSDELSQPPGTMIRNGAIGVALAMALSYLAGRRRGKKRA